MTKSPSAPATCSPSPLPHPERTRGRLAAATIASCLLSACGLLTGPEDSESLEAARARWKEQGPRDYSYEVRWVCECLSPANRWIRITVVDGDIVEGRYLDSNEIVEFRYWRDLPTVPDLFDRVEEILGQGPDRFDALYHRDDGHPILLLVDQIENAMDDEYSLQSRNLQPIVESLRAGGN